MQHHALAVEGQHDHRPLGRRLAIRRTARLVEGVEVLSRPNHQLFRLTLGHLRPGAARQVEQRFVEGPRGGRRRHPPPHLERVTLPRQVERGIERMQTLVTSPRVAHPLDLHRAEDRFQVAFVHAALRALDTVGPLDRTRGLPRAALIEVPLQELAHQLLAPPVQLPFEVALAHLLGFARREVRFGLGEGHLGRRIRRRVGSSGAGGDGSHRSTLPQPPLRMPDHRINQDRLGRLAGAAAVPIHPTSTAGGAQRDPVGGAVRTPMVAARIHQRLHQPRLKVVVVLATLKN